MGVLVAAATGVLHLAGRVILALLVIAFFILYAALGLLLTPLVAGALMAATLPRRLRVLARLTARLHRPLITAFRSAFRQRPSGP